MVPSRGGRMIRVAWQVPNSPEWVGGLNYFINLTNAILAVPDRGIEPVLLGGTKGLPEPLCSCTGLAYPGIPVGRWNPWNIMDGLHRRWFDSGGALAGYLKQHNIGLLSHGQILGRRSPVPAMCWIPDFQHVHLPTFFTEKDIAQRNNMHADIAARAQAVVLSSEDARQDFLARYPVAVDKTYVLRFVATMPDFQNMPDLSDVLKRYDIHEPYFHIPNQLWAHKNHNVVVEALKILLSRGCCPLVVSTGQTNDYRNTTFFTKLKKQVDAYGLEDRFRFLGLTPFADMSMLMRGAIAMINPSLFEGWSTTVEEAKSLGKRLLLSDIRVHREQNPDRGVFFDPFSPEELAEIMISAMNDFKSEEELVYVEKAKSQLQKRIISFGNAYQDIVLRVISS